VARATLGATLAIFVRAIPVALGIGIVWSGPLEHLTHVDVGEPVVPRPAAGGARRRRRPTTCPSAAPKALVSLYVAIAAGHVFARRDITGGDRAEQLAHRGGKGATALIATGRCHRA